MRDCIKTFVTPASTSLFIGGLSASILFIVSHTEGNDITTASAASHYLSAFANLAAENAITGMCTAGAVTTALFYTFIAKPAETMHKKCCTTNTNNEPVEDTTRYNRI